MHPRPPLQDGTESLLSWIARQLATASPPLPVLAAEAPHVVHPRLRVPVDEAAAALAAVEAGLAAVRAELERLPGEEATPDGRSGEAAGGGRSQGSSSSGAGDAGSGGAQALAVLAAELSARLAAARGLLEDARSGFASLAAYYGESAAAMASEQELWLCLQAFAGRLSAAQRAAHAAVAQEAKDAAARLRRQPSGSKDSSRQGLAAMEDSDRGQGGANGGTPAAASMNGSGAQAAGAAAARQLNFSSPAKHLAGAPASGTSAAET